MDLVLAPRACFPPPTQCVVGTSAPLDAGLQLAAVVYLSPFETSSAAPRSYRHHPPHRGSHASRSGDLAGAHPLGALSGYQLKSCRSSRSNGRVRKLRFPSAPARHSFSRPGGRSTHPTTRSGWLDKLAAFVRSRWPPAACLGCRGLAFTA